MLTVITTTGSTGECWFGPAPVRTDYQIGTEYGRPSGNAHKLLGRSSGEAASFGRHGVDHRETREVPPPSGSVWVMRDGRPELDYGDVAYGYRLVVTACDTLLVDRLGRVGTGV